MLRLLVSLALLAPVEAQVWAPGGTQAPRTSRPVVRPIHVDALASGAEDGSSWDDAFRDLQDALGVAQSGDKVWVASSIYTPSASDAAVSFVVPDGVELYGGFDGTEVLLEQRDWLAHPTHLSGDIGFDDVVGSGSAWYLGWNIGSSNSGHVLDLGGVGPETLIDGFTIGGGHTGPSGTSAGSPLMLGGGVYAPGGSPTLRHCTFEHNLTAFAFGGGVYVSDGHVVLEDCRFLENYAHSGGGAGLAVVGTGSATVRGCTFERNQAVAGQGSAGNGDGAGVFLWCDGESRVEGCSFEGNVARPFYSVGDELGYGAGIWSWNHAVVRDCEFRGNRANLGAGLILWSEGAVVNCLFAENVAVPQPNDLYPENGGFGAGILIYSAAPAPVLVEGCTLANNHGKKFVGLYTLGNGAEAQITNSILWGNVATHPEAIGFWTEQLDGNWSASYSCIAHVFEPKEPGEDPPDPDDLPGCLDVAPQFLSAPADLSLGLGSPCVDAGDNSAVPARVTLDLVGAPRFVDDPLAPDLGVGPGPIVDMGALERQH